MAEFKKLVGAAFMLLESVAETNGERMVLAHIIDKMAVMASKASRKAKKATKKPPKAPKKAMHAQMKTITP